MTHSQKVLSAQRSAGLLSAPKQARKLLLTNFVMQIVETLRKIMIFATTRLFRQAMKIG